MVRRKPYKSGRPGGGRGAPVEVVTAFRSRICLSGLNLLLSRDLGVRVVAESTDGLEAVAAAGDHTGAILVLEENLPHINGIEVARRVTKSCPETRVVLLMDHTDPPRLLRALQAGVSAIVCYSAREEDLTRALSARPGAPYLCPKIPQEVARRCIEAVRSGSPRQDILTPRQREVLQLLAEGHSIKRIGSLLGLSAKTVETHKHAISNRLSIHDMAGLVRYAIREGMVRP